LGALADGCSAFDTTSPLCDSHGAITSVTERDATQCRAIAGVRFYRLAGGIHAWYNTPMDISGQVPYNAKFGGLDRGH